MIEHLSAVDAMPYPVFCRRIRNEICGRDDYSKLVVNGINALTFEEKYDLTRALIEQGIPEEEVRTDKKLIDTAKQILFRAVSQK